MILISEIPLNVNQLGDERFFYPGDILGTEKRADSKCKVL